MIIMFRFKNSRVDSSSFTYELISYILISWNSNNRNVFTCQYQCDGINFLQYTWLNAPASTTQTCTLSEIHQFLFFFLSPCTGCNRSCSHAGNDEFIRQLLHLCHPRITFPSNAFAALLLGKIGSCVKGKSE